MSNPGWTGAWHPLAERFPMVGEDELRDMASSITDHGQFVPCVMDPNGLGLDGRNRVAACELAGVAPEWQMYDGDPVAFIVQVNGDRRHLTTGQRAMAVAIGLQGSRVNGRFKRGSVPDANGRSPISTWRDAVKRAGFVLDHAPDLADPVLAGTLALDAAHKQATEAKDAADRLESIGGELAALVHNSVITIAEAERRYKERARIDALPADLKERVNGGTLSVDEADLIVKERGERLRILAEKVETSVETLWRMAGYQIPPDLSALLTPATRAALAPVLQAFPARKHNEEQ